MSRAALAAQQASFIRALRASAPRFEGVPQDRLTALCAVVRHKARGRPSWPRALLTLWRDRLKL